MTSFALTFRADTPLALRSGRDTEHATTLSYIPATSLLGALASAHSWLRPNQAEQFAAFFLQERVSLGNAYPASFAGQRQLHDARRRAVDPLPLTARSCKRWSGFRFQDQEEGDHHGVWDHLIPWAFFALSDQQEFRPLRRRSTCDYPGCGETVDRLAGFYRRSSGNAIGKADERKEMVTRTGTSRRRGTVQEHILYSREQLPEGSRYWSRVEVDLTLADGFEAFLDEVRGRPVLRVGTSRTRGLGKLSLLDPERVEPTDATTVRERCHHFTEALHTAARQAGVPAPDRSYVPLTCTSAVLLRDEQFRYQTLLDAACLEQAGVVGGELVYATAEPVRILGWNGILGLPRAAATAIGMGSVFLFGFTEEPNYERLAALEHHGIGERRAEGFGRLRVADPFHWEVQGA